MASKCWGLRLTPNLVFLSILTKLLNNRNLYFFQSGALVKSVIRRTNLQFCIVLLFSQSFTMALMFGVVQMLKI